VQVRLVGPCLPPMLLSVNCGGGGLAVQQQLPKPARAAVALAAVGEHLLQADLAPAAGCNLQPCFGWSRS
jgi:hypothetical protein